MTYSLKIIYFSISYFLFIIFEMMFLKNERMLFYTWGMAVVPSSRQPLFRQTSEAFSVYFYHVRSARKCRSHLGPVPQGPSQIPVARRKTSRKLKDFLRFAIRRLKLIFRLSTCVSRFAFCDFVDSNSKNYRIARRKLKRKTQNESKQ